MRSRGIGWLAVCEWLAAAARAERWRAGWASSWRWRWLTGWLRLQNSAAQCRCDRVSPARTAAARRPQQPHRGLVLCLRCRSSHPSACCCVGRRSPWSSREWRHAGGGVALQCTTTIPYRRANGIAQGPNRTPIESTVAVASSSAAQCSTARRSVSNSSPLLPHPSSLLAPQKARQTHEHCTALHHSCAVSVSSPFVAERCFSIPLIHSAATKQTHHPHTHTHTHTHNTYSHTHSPLNPSVG